MQNCFHCGQEVLLKRSEGGIWQRMNPGHNVHRCLTPKKLWVICAGCKKVLSIGEGSFEEADRKQEVSHGMCEECLKPIEAETNKFWNSAAGIVARQQA